MTDTDSGSERRTRTRSRAASQDTETTAPETTAPENSTPENSTPENSTPESSVPQSTAPEATAPDATAPDATAPDATAPGADAGDDDAAKPTRRRRRTSDAGSTGDSGADSTAGDDAAGTAADAPKKRTRKAASAKTTAKKTTKTTAAKKTAKKAAKSSAAKATAKKTTGKAAAKSATSGRSTRKTAKQTAEKAGDTTAAAESTEAVDGVEDTAERPAAEATPVEQAPVQETGVQEAAVQEPATEEPAAEEPAAEGPAVQEPAAEEPAAEEPAAEEAPGEAAGASGAPAEAGPVDEAPAEDARAAEADGEDGAEAPSGEAPKVVRRKRRRRATQEAAEAEAAEAEVAEAETAGGQEVAGETAATKARAEAPAADEAAAGAAGSEDTAAERAEEAAEEAGEAERDRSRRRRGRRGRGKRGGRSKAAAAPEAETAGAPEARTDEEDKAAGDEAGRDGAPTRVQARRGRGRGRSGAGRGPSGGPSGRGARGRRPLGAVSEETRRAITEGPPRRMLVTVGDERTQLAVLEERTLVEHFVTRREDASYVGNIYMGRVQNVLPGMEAAFVDVGKGRNGVLYAGEVDYDPADLDGEVPRIEQTLKPGQTVLVQVTKDPMGTKGARLTQQLSIAGRYCVLAPGDGMLGISRKLPDEERERLRKILKSIKPDEYGLIVRTAAEGATTEQLEADVARLVRIWEQVEERAKTAKALEPVYEEPDLVIRVIRDVFGPEYTDLIVDSDILAEQIRNYLTDVSPELVSRVTVPELRDAGDGQREKLFDAYEVTNQIRRALEKKVWLPSGGYLIIEKTEAMWVIDVNTGKFVGKSNLEETVLRNNLEAAEEIARQLRLRDMGGIIVIDFVDMLVAANREEVLKRFRRELARDKTKSRVMEISKLGLVQMTRKNVSQGLQESFTTRCDVCEGRGARIVDHIV